ncbi:unnamed protein product [Alopecurus aequalis]
MDLHALSRRDLQALAKRNGVKANMTNAAMVDGIEEYVQQPVAETEVQAATPEEETTAEEEEEAEATEEEKEEKEEREKQGIMLDDSEEEEKAEEKAPALAMGRRRATRRAQIEPVAAPATRRKAAASNAQKGDAAAEDVPAPPATRKKAAASKAEKGDAAAEATRARSQKTVSWAEDEAPKARPTTRRAAARKTGTEQEEEEVEAAVPAPASSDEGNDGAEEVEAVVDEEQLPAAKAEKAAEAVPAWATRGRARRTVMSVAEEEAPKTRRTSRRSMAIKTSTEQEEEEKGDVSDMETAAAPAPVSSNERGDGAEEMEVAIDAHNEEENEPVEEPVEAAEPPVAVPARTTRTRSKRTVVPVADEEAPKARRTSRRAVARNSSTEQEEQEKEAQGDVSDMEVAVPAPVSSEEGGHDAEEMEAAMDVQNEEQIEAVPVRATRGRSKRTVLSVAEEEAPKARRTSRRAAARSTSTEKEEEEKGTQGDVSDTGAVVSAPASSDEGCNGAEETEATNDAQNEEQFAAAEAVPARATRARRQRAVVSVAEEEAPKARRTSRRTATKQEEEVQCQQQQDIASDVEAAVPAPVSSDVGSDGAEGMEASMESLNDEQNELVEEHSEDHEGVVADKTPLLEEEEEPVAEAEDCPVDSSVEEQTDTVYSEEVQHSNEDTEMVTVQEVAEEIEDCTAEDEPAVAEHVDSSVQEPLVDVQQCEGTEEIQLASEDAKMVLVNEVPQVTVKSGEADFTSDVDHSSEENEDCTTEEEAPVEEHVDVQQCEGTEEIQLASEDSEMVLVNEVPQVTVTSGEADFTSDVDHSSEENEDCATEEEAPVEEHVDSSVEELLAIDQCQDAETVDIHLATEDAEMVPVDELPQAILTTGEATAESDFTSDVDHASEENEDCMVEEPVAEDVEQCEATEDVHLAVEETEMVHVNEVLQATLNSGEVTEEVDFASYDEVLQSAAKASEKKQDMAAEEETPVATDEIPQMSEAMDVGVVEVVTVENLFATVTDEESDFSCDISVQDCVVDSSVEEQHDSEEIEQSSDESGEDTEEVDFTSVVSEEIEDCTVQQEPPAPEDVDSSVQDLLVDAVQQCQNSPIILGLVEQEGNNTTEEIHSPSEDTEMVPVNDAPQATLTSGEAAEEVGFSSENALQSAAEASKEKEEMVTVEVQQWSEAMYEEVVEVVAVNDKDESWFSPDPTAVFMDEEATVADDEMPHSSATKEENVEEVVAVKESGFAGDQADVSVEEEENVEEVDQAVAGGHTPVVTSARDFSDHITSPFSANLFECATKSLSMDSIAAKQSGFTGKLMDMSVEEQGVVAADEMPQSSATVEENVEEEVTFENLPQVTVTDDEWAVTLSAWLENMSQVKEMFTFDSLLQATLTEDEETAVAAANMVHSSATKEENAEEEVAAVENVSQAKESGVLQTAVDTASDHTPSPQSANVFQYATKYLSSMDSITAKPTVSETADVMPPLCVYNRSVRKLKITEPMSVQREKVAKKPEALGSVSVRRLKMKIKADDAPLCIYGGENNNPSEALGSRSLRKLRTEFNEIVAVAQENEAKAKEGKKPSTPLDTLSLRQLKQRLRETLNAQNQKNTEQPTRVPLGRLDENAW